MVFLRHFSQSKVKVTDQISMLPFVPGCWCRRLCLVCCCAFGSRQLWTSELDSFWTVPLDPPGLRPEEGRPGRDHCCDGHGEACLWRWKNGEKTRGEWCNEKKIRDTAGYSNIKPLSSSVFRSLFCLANIRPWQDLPDCTSCQLRHGKWWLKCFHKRSIEPKRKYCTTQLWEVWLGLS